eukprot:scaffold41701_cov31-Tisochrysis_lutea.AAC.1
MFNAGQHGAALKKARGRAPIALCRRHTTRHGPGSVPARQELLSKPETFMFRGLPCGVYCTSSPIDLTDSSAATGDPACSTEAEAAEALDARVAAVARKMRSRRSESRASKEITRERRGGSGWACSMSGELAG